MVVVAPERVRLAKVGVEVVVTDWSIEELPKRLSAYPPPLMVTWEIVEVEMAEEIMEFVPVNVVLPPCKDKVLLSKVKVPEPEVKVKPLTVVKEGVAVKVI